MDTWSVSRPSGSCCSFWRALTRIACMRTKKHRPKQQQIEHGAGARPAAAPIEDAAAHGAPRACSTERTSRGYHSISITLLDVRPCMQAGRQDMRETGAVPSRGACHAVPPDPATHQCATPCTSELLSFIFKLSLHYINIYLYLYSIKCK